MSFILFVLGLFIGSFLGVVADRMPQDKSITGRSHCEYCKKTLAPQHLIPLLSFIFQLGGCFFCHRRLSYTYPLIELATGLLFALPWIIGRPEFLAAITPESLLLNSSMILQTWAFLISWLLIASTIVVTLLTDIRFHIILDESSLTFLLATFILGITRQGRLFDPTTNPFVGGIILLLLLMVFYLLTRGKGMGLGDVKFAFPMGMLLGTTSGLIALYLSFIIGGLYSMGILLVGKAALKQKIAFGPFLIIGMMIVFLCEREITGLLMSFFS